MTDEDEETPLYSALDIDIDPRIRKELYAKGADLNHTNKAGKTPLVKMLENKVYNDGDFHLDAVFELLYGSKDLNTCGLNLVNVVSLIHPRENAENQNHRCLEFLQYLMQNGVEFGSTSDIGKTVLHSLASVCCIQGFEFI